MDTLVGIVKANDIDDAKEKLKKSYTTCDIDRFDIEEVSFSKNDIIEQTPHSHSPTSKQSVGGGLEWGIFYINKR